MKYIKIFTLAALSLAVAACSMEDITPQSGTMTMEQLQDVFAKDPSRAEAQFSGMFTKMAKPRTVFPNSSRADDFGFIALLLSNDLEGADAIMPDSNYNWFSVCGEYTSRTPSYANPYLRYAAPYNLIADANACILQFASDPNKVAQSKALRAYAYMELAPFFQVRYVDGKDLPCVPLVTEETTDFANNPRATVGEIYDQIIKDLTDAVTILSADGMPARTSKARIDASVALALRARAYLMMAEYEKALADATEAAKGYEPATLEEVSHPSFYNINDHNWIWGYDMAATSAQINPYCTCTSWMSSFCGNGYGPATQCYLYCNNLLYDKIPASDVRKGWWVDDELHSPLLEGLSWTDPEGNTAKGQEIAHLEYEDKAEFLPYSNVKFGAYQIGTTLNEEDFPFIRVEEMILIQAECEAALGNAPKAESILVDFVKKNRDPEYAIDRSKTLMDEIWFQRRIELWGEGFFVPDARRLNKPIVRTHGTGTCNQPVNFEFNIPADDPWLNMRFSDSETNTNAAIKDNEGGVKPEILQHSDLRDGVTD